MGRKGWTVMECEVLRGPRPLSVRWPVVSRQSRPQSTKSPAQGKHVPKNDPVQKASTSASLARSRNRSSPRQSCVACQDAIQSPLTEILLVCRLEIRALQRSMRPSTSEFEVFATSDREDSMVDDLYGQHDSPSSFITLVFVVATAFAFGLSPLNPSLLIRVDQCWSDSTTN